MREIDIASHRTNIILKDDCKVVEGNIISVPFCSSSTQAVPNKDTTAVVLQSMCTKVDSAAAHH